LNIINKHFVGNLQEQGILPGGLSDCEELVGGCSQEKKEEGLRG
jgi:hypothetical protein